MGRIQHVVQQERMGCGVACVAMLSGKTYQQVRALFDPDHPKRDFVNSGLNDLVMPQLLRAAGLAGVITYPYNPLTGERRTEWPLLPAGDAIFCVQSDQGAHYVVRDKFGVVYDPALMKTKQSLDRYAEVFYYIEIFPIAHV